MHYKPQTQLQALAVQLRSERLDLSNATYAAPCSRLLILDDSPSPHACFAAAPLFAWFPAATAMHAGLHSLLH
jgi:hypothetical protein